MGYLDKSTITVDAILTNRGRELLSQGTGKGNFQITKFAVADDEVDYTLYNVAHPLGSNYYGAIIENMPVLEATPDETQIMKYKLVTITGADSQGTIVIPQISSINYTSQTLNFSNLGGTSNTLTIQPTTTYTTSGAGEAEDDGYTIILADGSLATLEVLTPQSTVINVNTNGSVTAKGLQFKITAKNRTGDTTVSIFGNNSGATYSFSLRTIEAS